MSDRPLGEGWWIASDGRWYPPEQHPSRQPIAPPPPVPPPPVPGRKRKGRGFMISSIFVGAFGALAILGGAVVKALDSVIPVIDPVAEATTPDPLVFDALSGEYQLSVSQLSGDELVSLAGISCTATLADGTVAQISGRDSAPPVDVNGRRSRNLGGFTAVAGTTTVNCTATGPPVLVSVGESLPVEEIGQAVLVGGIVICGLAAALLVVGIVRWRATA